MFIQKFTISHKATHNCEVPSTNYSIKKFESCSDCVTSQTIRGTSIKK